MQAQMCLAMLFEDGLGVKQNSEQAFRYYKLASMQKWPIAIAQLGKFYEEGKGGVEKSPLEAFRHYKMAADLGSLVAWEYLAEAYEKGIGVEKSEEKVRFCLRKIFLSRKQQADQGDSLFQACVGLLFENGEGVEKSLESAVHYYQMAANQNSLRGLLYLGDCYAEGKGVQKSSTKAIYYYKLAADQGYLLAQSAIAQYLLKIKINEEQAVHYLKLVIQQGQGSPGILAYCADDLALCFEKGIGVEKSYQNAVYYYKIASDHGYVSAQRRLGAAFFYAELELKRSLKLAIEYYQLAGNQGDSFSYKMIGQCYEIGLLGCDVEYSPEKAFYYYNLGAEIDIKKGSFYSIYELAKCYEKGIGIEKSLEKAAFYYKFAAENDSSADNYYKVACCYNAMGGEQNTKKAAAYFKMAIKENNPFEPVAQFNLAKVFEASLVLENSVSEGFNYYRQSADQGDSHAQYFMGNLYKWGKGVERSTEESLKYYKLAADQDYGPALWELAYYYGSDEVKDYKRACEYCKKAADLGCAEAQCYLGFNYQNGKGVNVDLTKAIQYYQLAAEQNNKVALYNLGICYQDGIGVAQSLEEAFKYFKKAADQGFDRGQFNVARCYRWGLGVEESLEHAIEYYELALAQNYRKEKTLETIQECKNKQMYREKERQACNACQTMREKLSKQLDRGTSVLKKKKSIISQLSDDQKTIELNSTLINLLDQSARLKERARTKNYDLIIECAELRKLNSDLVEYGKACKEFLAALKKSYEKKQNESLLEAWMDASDYEPPQNDFQIDQAHFPQESYNLTDFPVKKFEIKFSQNANSNQKAFLALKEQADKGSADAQFEIGHSCEEGKNVQQSYKSAFHYYKLAADQGHPKAQTYLAMLFEDGFGVKQNSELAFYYYQLASIQKCPIAIAQVGKFYEEGKGGVEKSPKEAIRYFKMARDLGSTVAWGYLAQAYEQGIGVKKSEAKAQLCRRKKFLLLKDQADRGNSGDQANVGLLFENGEGVEKSIESAIHNYQMSANQNASEGLLRLADCYAKGKGVQKSSKKAYHYYKLASDQGSPVAQLSTAHYFLENKINEEQAVYYLKLVVQHGHCGPKLLAYCAYELGLCLETGTGVKQSNQNALYYYKIASDLGDVSAQKRFGDAFLNRELGLKKSSEKAIEYYQLAAKQGCSLSLEMIGRSYEKGEGVEQSAEKAFYYHNKGAEIDIKNGYCSSIYELGRCYELGIGTEKSLENAVYYYKLAAENGSTVCYYKVGCCYSEMGGEENAKKAAAYFKMAITEIDPFAPVAQLALAEVLERFGLEKSVAFNYYRLSADQGDPHAQYFMGNLHKWGKGGFNGSKKGVQQSKEESLKYYKLSADQEYGPALMELADFYRAEDYKKACEYYKKAADQGFVKAQVRLGNHYYSGNGVDVDLSKAVYYYHLAAEQNNTEALLNLAACYKNGRGVAESSVDAFEYFKKAADQGSACGQFNVAYCYSWGLGVKESLEKAIEYYELALAQNYRREGTLAMIQECKDRQIFGEKEL